MTIKIINRTSRTSINGVTLISDERVPRAPAIIDMGWLLLCWPLFVRPLDLCALELLTLNRGGMFPEYFLPGKNRNDETSVISHANMVCKAGHKTRRSNIDPPKNPCESLSSVK